MSLNGRQLEEDHHDGGELKYLPQEERLMELGLFSLEKEMASGGPTISPQFQWGSSLHHQDDGVGLLIVMYGRQ